MNRYAVIPWSIAIALTSLPAEAQQFVAHEQYPVGNDPTAIISADFDQQNGPDVVTTNSADNTISILQNFGDGRFLKEEPPGSGDLIPAITTINVNSYPSDVVTADFNNDGLPDLAIINRESNHLSVFLHQGGGPGTIGFNATHIDMDPETIGDNPVALTSGLFNNDSYADLAIAFRFSSDLPTIAVMLSNGDGSFQFSDSSVGLSPSDVTNADFNDDGHLDLIVANNLDSTLSFLAGDGTGSFTIHDYDNEDTDVDDNPIQTDLALDFRPLKLHAADVDADGHQDLVVTQLNDGKDSSRIHILLNSGEGNGTFITEDAPSYEIGVSPSAVISGHFNNYVGLMPAAMRDEHLDLIVTSLDSNTALTLFGQGDGTFIMSEHYYSAGADPIDLVSSDFDQDGINDLAVLANTTNKVGIIPGNKDGTFRTAITRPFNTENKTIRYGDFNNDGLNDIAEIDPASNELNVRLRKHENTFAPIQSADSTTELPTAITVGQFNDDELDDIAIAIHETQAGTLETIDAYAKVFLAQNSEDDTFTLSTNYNLITSPLTVPSDIASADFDNDGSDDLAITSSSSHNVLVMPSLGDGSFGDSILLSTGTEPSSLVIHDVNVDSLPDIATLNSGYETLSVMLNDGNFNFNNPHNYPVSGDPRSLLAEDYDKNGLPDFVVSYHDSQKMNVFSGNVNGTVDRPQNFSTGRFPRTLTVGNFNDDQIPDIAATITNSDSVLFLFGNGDGSFRPGMNTSIGNTPSHIIAVDVDDDGIDEVIVSDDSTTGQLYVLTSQGNGIYLATQSYRTAKGSGSGPPTEIITTDFNLDGITDLAVANMTRNNVGLLAGNADGTYQDADNTPEVGETPISLTSADLNNDTYPDFVTANSGGNSLSIVVSDGEGGYLEEIGTLITTGTPTAVTGSDFNGDGHYDLAVSSNGESIGHLVIFTNDGSLDASNLPSFTKLPGETAKGVELTHLKANDFDQDGDIDLIATDVSTSEIILFTNDGSAGFTQENENYSAGTAPNYFTLADIDMDGGDDIITTGREISVLLNNGNYMPSPFNITPYPDAPISTPGTDPIIVTIGDNVPVTIAPGSDPIIEKVTSDPISIAGLATNAKVLIENGEYSKNGQAFTTERGSVTNGDTIEIRTTTAYSAATTTHATLIIGGYSDKLEVTTIDDGTKPDPFAFENLIDVELDSFIDSNPVTITGLTAPSRISVSGGWYSINNGDFVNTVDYINNNDVIIARVITAPESAYQNSVNAYQATSSIDVTIGGITETFSATTIADTSPDPFFFSSKIGVKPQIQVISFWQTITGITGPTPISIEGGHYSLISEPNQFTDADGFINNGERVRISVLTPKTYDTTKEVKITIGDRESVFEIRTQEDPRKANDDDEEEDTGVEEKSLFGCTLQSRQTGHIDPTLPMLVLFASLALWRRKASHNG